MDKEARGKIIERVIVKVWNMSKASVSPDAEPEDEQVVRIATLEWAKEAIFKACEGSGREIDSRC